MTSHPTPTPISGDAEAEAISLNIPRAFWAHIWVQILEGGCDHTLRHTEEACGVWGLDWGAVSDVLSRRGLVCDCEAVLNWTPLSAKPYPEYTEDTTAQAPTQDPVTNSEYSPTLRGREVHQGDSHTTILPPRTHGDAQAEPDTNRQDSPLDGRTRSIAHSQRVVGWVRPRTGAVQRGGGTDTDRFHVSYSQPALPCGLSGADKGEYSMEVRT